MKKLTFIKTNLLGFLTVIFSVILLSACNGKPNNKELSLNNAHIIEIVIYKINSGVNDQEHIKHALAITPILAKFDGFVFRQFSKTEDGRWIDLVYWRDLSSAEKAAAEITTMPSCQAFFADINQNKMEFMHSKIITHYP